MAVLARSSCGVLAARRVAVRRRDSVGPHPGALMGNVAGRAAGALADGDRAMLFDGTSGSIQVPGSAALRASGDLTIELWVNVSLAGGRR